MDRAIEGGFDGMIVYVNQAGKSQFYSAGYSNRENQLLADPHILFKIASISKLYIAAAISKLVVAGDLSIDQNLAELIPETVNRIEYARQIKLRHLVSHKSGIPEYIFEPGFDGGAGDSYLSTAALIFDKDADFKPGEDYGYSNTNYLLLGEIMDRSLGYSHHEYIKEEILIPLGLNNTFSLYEELDPSQVMSGYLLNWDEDLKSQDHTRPGGSMIASAEDVGLFLRALIDGRLLNPREQALYTSLYPYEHTGWLNGYTSIARYHSDIDAVVVQFVNTSGKEIFWLELERSYNRILKALKNE